MARCAVNHLMNGGMVTAPTPLQQYRQRERDDAKLCAGLKAQMAQLKEERRKLEGRLEELEIELIEAEDAIAKLEKR